MTPDQLSPEQRERVVEECARDILRLCGEAEELSWQEVKDSARQIAERTIAKLIREGGEK